MNGKRVAICHAADGKVAANRGTPDEMRVGEFTLLGFCSGGLGRFQEVVEAEEFATEGAAVGGPLGFAGIEGEGGAVTPKLHEIS